MRRLTDLLKNIKLKFNYKQYVRTNILFFTTTFSLLINAILIRIMTVGNFLEVKPVVADFAIILVLLSPAYLLKPKKQIIYFTIISILMTTICVINSMYFTYYSSFASVSLISTSLQVINVAEAVTENVMQLRDFIYLWQPIVVLFVHFNLIKKNYYRIVEKVEKGKQRLLGTFITGLVMIGIFFSTLTALEIGRFSNQWNREFLVMKFGIYTYQLNDIVRSLEPKITAAFGYDEAVREIRQYYEENKRDIKTNKYTNIFKGKNLLMIHAESIQQFVMDLTFNGEEVTPNLNKLAKEGMFFSNFYSQVGVGTSSDTEFTLSTSLMPSTNGTVFVSYWDREYITIPKLLKEKGYYAFSMHGNKGDMWNRLVMHKELGYDRFFNRNDYEIDEVIGFGLSDKSFFRQSIEKIKTISNKHSKYYGTLIMLSNHTPFDDLDKYGEFPVDYKINIVNEDGIEEEITRPYMEGTSMGNYLKSVHYADAAIGEFIAGLETEGLLKDTVIVIYGDHDARLPKKDFIRLYNYDPYTDTMKDVNDPTYRSFDYYEYELNRKVPLIIWSKEKMLKTEVSEMMGMYDVLPTLGNMFDFRSEYQLGNDIFSVDNNVVIFPNGNWLTKDIYYNNQKQEFKLLNDSAVVSQEYINKFSKIAYDKINVSNNIILFDYIRKSKETEKLLETYKN
ncbi:MAG TPA: LTA synthase family protein [Mollicutes bacterium]|nr:LTA synthase family protein [Mollicutes bacterium]